MLLHDYVPEKFGSGTLCHCLAAKGKTGDVSRVDNYRAIAVSTVLSNVL